MTTITAHPTTLGKSHRKGGSRSAERRRAVAIPVIVRQYFELSEHPYDLWVDGRLHDELGIPDDGKTRIEIIGGVIVLSPGPLVDHAGIASDIRDAFTLARADNKEYPWRCADTVDFNLRHRGEGYIPDVIVLDAGEFAHARADRARHVVAEQVGMVVEITSQSTAPEDREPDPDSDRPTKWNGYAHEDVEWYLLVDRDPNSPGVTLFTDPHMAHGTYQRRRTWAFGEAVVLPEPFNIEISTDAWKPWKD